MSNVSLNIGLNALLTSQAALDTIGHNISNANTPGFSRQSIDLTPGRPNQLRGLQIGSGVDAEGVERTIDEFVNRRLVGQVSALRQIEARLSALGDTEAILGEPGDNGISASLENMFARFAELSSDPRDSSRRASTVASIEALAADIRGVGTQLEQTVEDIEGRLRSSADQASSLAASIADLNVQIVNTESTGTSANDLRDRREQALQQLSEHIGVSFFETPRGAVNVFVDGRMLVSDTSANDLSIVEGEDGGFQVMIDGGTQPIEARSGAIGGLLAFAESTLPALRSGLDEFALNLVREVNRRHSTGTPPSGGFRGLTADLTIVDADGDGSFLDEKLDALGGAFQVEDGELYVHVVRDGTGETNTQRLEIDAGSMTVGDLVDRLSGVAGLTANVDAIGRVQIQADAGFSFDFSRRFDRAGNTQGTLGGGAASIGTAAEPPFSLIPGDTLTLDSGAGPFTVTFQPDDFDNLVTASPQEVAAAINADPNTAANGLRAIASEDQVFLQSLSSGAGVSFDVVGGSAAAALGLTPGTTVTGQDRVVEVEIAGTYNGSANETLTFRPNIDGEIGVTPGLEIEVFDSNGVQVGSLDVGAGYQPGVALELPQGIEVSFSGGAVSASDGDAFSRQLLVDSDTADVLVALGIGGLLTGDSASTIAVADRIMENNDLFATSANGDGGDNGVLLELAGLQSLSIDELDGSLGGFYADLVGEVGVATQSADRAVEVESQLLTSLETRRDQVSGVSLDEELVNLIQFEQAFGAASRFIQVANSLQDELLNIL